MAEELLNPRDRVFLIFLWKQLIGRREKAEQSEDKVREEERILAARGREKDLVTWKTIPCVFGEWKGEDAGLQLYSRRGGIADQYHLPGKKGGDAP